jgi:predicted transcriptional regulator
VKKTIKYIEIASALVGLAPLGTAIWSAVKFVTSTSDKTFYFFIGLTSISILGLISLFYIVQQSKFKNTNVFKIEELLDNYYENEGRKFIDNNGGQYLINKTKNSIKDLEKKGVTGTLSQDVYYIYLYSLLNGASKRIWAASIMGEEEWVDTPEEEEFLRLNLLASRRDVLVERIFIIEKSAVKKMLDNPAIKIMIARRNDYMKTYFIIKEALVKARQNLLTDIGSGFLAFDDFAIASDVFEDSYIRGILNLDDGTIKKNNRIFTNLRDFAKPLDQNFIEEFENSLEHGNESNL